MKKTAKILTVLLCLCMVLALVFGTAYVAQHAGHECVDDHCEICVLVAGARQILRQVQAGAGLYFALALCLFAAASLAFVCRGPVAQTRVLLGVQLNI